MDVRRSFILALLFSMAVSLGTANMVFAPEEPAGGLSNWTAKLFGNEYKWKTGKEKAYKGQFKVDLSIGDRVERVEFPENYVGVYNAELNDEPPIMFIGKPRSGNGLLDNIYEESDMHK